MKLGWLLGVSCAVLFHALVLLFGGIFFMKDEDESGRLQQVDLLSDEVDKPKEEEQEKPPEEKEIETEEEAPPDATEVIHNLEQPVIDDAPALDAASLGALEQMLNGASGGGDFADAISLASGGRIGGRGTLGVGDESVEKAFNLDEIDQDARVVDQIAPTYPAELRRQKLEGSVVLKFIVDSTGKVLNPRVVESAHVAFDKPALDAVRRWKFEPAVKGGQRVNCFKRLVIRFKPSQGS